jgi:putative spermidine/putrescine transport system permease protein
MSSPGWALLPFAVLFGIFYLVPILVMLVKSVTEPMAGFQNYVEVATSPLYTRTILTTVLLAGTVALSALILGYPVAFLLTELRGWARLLLFAVVILPFWISLLVRTYAWIVLFARSGPVDAALGLLGVGPPDILYTPIAVWIGMLHILMPYMVLTLYAVLRDIDRSVLMAGHSLGASVSRLFVTVYFPLSLPGVIAGLALTFVMGVGFFVTPALLGGGKVITLAMLIDGMAERLLEYGLAGALSVSLLGVIAVILLLASRRVNLNEVVRRS